MQTVAGGTNWKQVSIGGSSCSSIKTDGTLWNWGKNSVGTLGNGTTNANTNSPVQTIAGGTNWKQTIVGANSYTNFDFMAAIKNNF